MRPAQMVARWSELGIVHESVPHMTGILEGIDVVGITTEPTASVSLVLCFGLGSDRVVGAGERADLTRLGLHLEAAARARLRPESVIGTITLPDGSSSTRTCCRATRAKTWRGRVDLIEELRTKRHRSEGERALALWKALTTGALSLLERVDTDGKRLYDLHENPPLRRTLRALGAQEQHVVTQAVRGLANKEIAYGLGLSPAYVSRLLSTGARKLGLSTGRALVQLAARLAPSPRPVDFATLTPRSARCCSCSPRARATARSPPCAGWRSAPWPTRSLRCSPRPARALGAGSSAKTRDAYKPRLDSARSGTPPSSARSMVATMRSRSRGRRPPSGK